MWRSLGLLLLTLLNCAAELGAIEVPRYQSRVIDRAGLLSSDELAAVDKRVVDFCGTNNVDLTVLIIPTLNGHSLIEFTDSVYQSWWIGVDRAGAGLLVVIALAERDARVAVGEGLRDRITDAEADRLTRRQSYMAQAFRRKEWSQGVTDIMEGLDAALVGDYDPPIHKDHRFEAPFLGVAMLIFLFLCYGFMIAYVLQKRNPQLAWHCWGREVREILSKWRLQSPSLDDVPLTFGDGSKSVDRENRFRFGGGSSGRNPR